MRACTARLGDGSIPLSVMRPPRPTILVMRLPYAALVCAAMPNFMAFAMAYLGPLPVWRSARRLVRSMRRRRIARPMQRDLPDPIPLAAQAEALRRRRAAAQRGIMSPARGFVSQTPRSLPAAFDDRDIRHRSVPSCAARVAPVRPKGLGQGPERKAFNKA